MSMSELSSVYEIDNEQWLERTIEILKEKRLEELDLEHLIEQLETLSRRNRLTREIVASEGAIIPKLIPSPARPNVLRIHICKASCSNQ